MSSSPSTSWEKAKKGCQDVRNGKDRSMMNFWDVLSERGSLKDRSLSRFGEAQLWLNSGRTQQSQIVELPFCAAP
jgi:hypothetical protein